MSADRRFYHWPAFVLAGVLAALGIWAFIAVQHSMGLTTGELPQAERSGKAQPQSCSRDPLYLWITWTCEAQVQWNGEENVVAERVISVRELTGTVDVQERVVPRKRVSTAREVVPADYPGTSDGALFFVMMMGFPVVGAAAGYFAGTRLARLLPEPPAKPEKLALRSKMSTRHDRDKRFNRKRRRP
ncbi:hypothetical protein DMH04_09225 [Kibdelosporangium aridum]|uniref:Uncharacterized protein n=1 Tax=Kibdelosporangium aridum TaxID=2030 RepID=A0A428ZIG2_KIBAR|nr:DUF6346 domain-containing protein [Kibdelosporangium aridum]RSM87896.1 hypothetical protein DMH04_09225 [Kibdelosporangium aridum]